MKRVAILSIRLYQVISCFFRTTRVPFYVHTDCRYYPSCSDFAIESIRRWGFVKGSAKSILRITRCSPLSKGGVDMP